MVSPDFCRTIQSHVTEIFEDGQQMKSQRANTSGANILSAMVDDQVKQHARVEGELARSVGCGVEFKLGATSVEAVCTNGACPLK